MALTTVQKANISNLYYGYFGRAGDAAGISFWEAELDSGQSSLSEIANAFATQPEATSTYAFLSAPNAQPADIEAFVSQVYQNLFNRAPDADGLAFWSGRLGAGAPPADFILGAMSAAQGADLDALARNAAGTPPFTDAQKAVVVELYVGYLGRAPDPASLNDWFGKLQSGEVTIADVADSIASQAEATTAIPYLSAPNLQLDIPAFIEAVYQNLFNRSVEQGGLDYWSGMLQAGATPGQFILGLLAVAQGDDLATLANREAAALAYTTEALQQGATWTLDDDRADAAQVIAGVTSDPNSLAAARTLAAQLVAADVAVGTTFPLTDGVDRLTGTIRDDTFTGILPGALGGLDSIDGGAGADTLNVLDTTAIAPGALVRVSSVEVANVESALGVTIDTSSWTGLAALNVLGRGAGNVVTASGTTVVSATSSATGAGNTNIQGGSDVTVNVTGSTTGEIRVGNTIAPTGIVTVTNTTSGTFSTVSMGAISVTGGTQVNVTQNATNAVNTFVTMGTVTVQGGASTTDVTVTNAAASSGSPTSAGVNNNTVAISDVNSGFGGTGDGTITTIDVSNYTTLSIEDNALRTLRVAGGSGNIIIDNSRPDAPTTTVLDLTVNGLRGGTLDDADIYSTLNVTTAGTASRLANMTFGALETLTIAGTETLTMVSTAGLSSLRTVTVSGAAGLTADLATTTTVTAVDTTASTGQSTVTLNASRASYTGGSGIDRVTTSSANPAYAISLGAGDDSLVLRNSGAAPTVALSGGDGTDSLTIDSTTAATASGSGAFAGLVTGFEQLVLTGATNQTVDLAQLGITDQVTTSGGNGLTLSGLRNGGTLVLNGAGTAYTINNADFTAGLEDTLNLTLEDSSTAGVAFASTGITPRNIENIFITTVDGQDTPTGSFNDSVTLLGNTARVITVAGNAGLTLTATSTAAVSVDASALGLGGFNWTSGALANAAVVYGSATGTNTVDLSAATNLVTYTGGSGNDSVTTNNGRDHVVGLGGGTNTYVGGAGNQTVTAGTGADTVTVGNGDNNVSLDDGNNAFTAGSGNNTYVGGAGIDTVTLGGGINVVTLGAGNDTINLTAPALNVFSATTLLDPTAGDTIVFDNYGTETFASAAITLPETAGLRDYADVVVAAGGNASANGAFGWFQFGGDTYLVESRHDGSVTQNFVGGTDAIIKLQGSVDLSTVAFNGSSAFTLT